jgi:NAD(P)-dependent dehydrogenase (short-subunit alcohol dehydrogenase family)/uncharacterized OB-fold protein
LPPVKRSRAARRLTAGAAFGRFELQRCKHCSAVQYPPREACHRCLCVELEWTLQSGAGRLIAQTTLFHSHEPFFRQRLPWRLGLVSLDAGPTVVAHLHQSVPTAPAAVHVTVRLDMSGQAVLIARSPGEDSEMNDDPRIREMSCDPRGRGVLITDGVSSVGRSLVSALIDAGAKRVWVGEPPGKASGLPSIAVAAAVTTLPLDIRSPESVAQAAQTVGDSADILINNSCQEGSPSSDVGVPDGLAREEMEINYFGLLNLSRHFLPAMQAPSATGTRSWVNVLSVYALSNLPSQATFCASMAAAMSFSQGLRARSRPSGLRVVNVFRGPLAQDGLAKAIVEALRSGVEDVYPGDVAQEWLARWLQSPKAFERELAG